MALIMCPECGKEISDKAAACIHCGYPVSAMKTEAAEPAQNAGPAHEVFQKVSGGNAAAQTVKTAPLKPVPKEMPEMKMLPGIIVKCLEKLCGVAGVAGFVAFVSLLADLLRGYGVEQDGVMFAVLGMGGAYLLALLLQAMKFHHAKRFLQKNGYEDSIRNDTPSLTNSLNAFRLYGSNAMARYIKSLNPIAGNALEMALKQAKDQKRKKRLGYLPYLAILAAAYFLILRFGWMMLPTYESCLIVLHLVTLVVLGFYGNKKGGALGIIVASAALFTLALYVNYMEDQWYHILICAAVAFAGMYIGGNMRKK